MLQLIYGKAGSGKTTACFQRAKEMADGEKTVLFIVPEGFSLAQERKVVAEFGAGVSEVGAGIRSVDVLSFNRLASQVFARFGPLTPEYSSSVVRQMLMQKTLVDVQNKLSILTNLDADAVLNLVDEFSRYMVTPEILAEFKPENQLFALKLQDIILIHKTYQKALEKRGLPVATPLTALCNRLDELIENPFKNTHFIVDQFTSFTPEEFAVVGRMLKLGKSVTVTLLTDSLEGNETATRMFELALKTGVEIRPNIHLKGERESEVTIFRADNPYGEVTECARKIVSLIKNGVPQNEIAVIAHDLATYTALIRQVFPRFGIDVFVDDAPSALQDAEVAALLAFVNVWVQKHSVSAVLKYLKTTDVPQTQLNMLENECLAMGRCDWPEGIGIPPRISGRKTVGQLIAALPPSENAVICQVVDEMNTVFGNEYITFEKFHSILKAGFSAVELTQIPQTKNQAVFCAVDRYKGHKPRCLFILGVQEGDFPARYATEGVISDSERTALASAGITLAETCEDKQIREQETVYFCTHSPQERLFLFHSDADFAGKELAPSPVLAQFPNAICEDNIYGKTISRGKPPKTRLKPMESAVISALYNSESTSISRIEAFSRCQFAYFMRYGLNATPRRENKITAPDSGNIMHSVVERFCKNGDFTDVSAIPDITRQVLEETCNETLRENPRFASVEGRIIAEMETVAANVAEFYNSTNFEPLVFEGELPPMTITLDDGREIALRGRVDRVDICRTAQGNYVSVVDYKSGEKSIKPEEVAVGVQVQLPVYIKAICEHLSKKSGGAAFFPAGMLYYQFSDPLCETEDVQTEIRKKLRMRGLMLDDGPNISNFAMKNAASLEEMEKVCADALKAVETQLKKITKGALAINPYNADACEYCDYSGVCRREGAVNVD